MKILFDTTDVKKLEAAIRKHAQIMPEQKAAALLRKAVKPTLRRAQIEVPVSKSGERISLSVARRAISRGSDPNAYRKGGATKRDLRIKSVKPGSKEVGRVLVGVSKRVGKVGWRTPFIQFGTKVRRTKSGENRGRVKANPFLQRAFDMTFDGVSADFQKEYRQAFVSWAKQTFPQLTK